VLSTTRILSNFQHNLLMGLSRLTEVDGGRYVFRDSLDVVVKNSDQTAELNRFVHP
jgi:hypothetical protein